eukprot:NODE_51_length_31136_cov_0.357670.p20 type:complete len:201 gc:universal NODE_51_length_31136_cov_0.357670:21992-21390(-)
MEAFRMALIAMTNPRRADAVAKTGELFMKSYNQNKLDIIYRKMKTNETGRRILIDKPIITSSILKDYPKNSFGWHYVRFIDENGFDLNRPKVTTDLNHPYLITRYRQIHDFNHVLFNLPPTVYGEAILKWIEYQQLEITMPLFAGLVGIYYNLTLDDIHYGLQQGFTSSFMMNIYYEELLSQPLDTVRNQLQITPRKPTE